MPPKRRQSVPDSRPRSAKKRRPAPHQSGSVRKSGQPSLSKFAASNSVRRKPSRERRLVLLSVAELPHLRRLLPCVRLPATTLGDAPALFRRPALPARLDQKARLLAPFLSTVLVLWEVEDGVLGKRQRRRQMRRVRPLLVQHRQRPERRHQWPP